MLRIIAKRLLWCAVFGVAFVVNPAYLSGCASEGEDENVDTKKVEADLLAELDEVNGTASWEFEVDGESYEVLLALTQKKGEDESASRRAARFMQVAHACGGHTFYQSASACFTRYELAIEGTLTLRKLAATPEIIAQDVEVSGTLGYGSDLSLYFGTDNQLRITTYEAEGDYQLAQLHVKDLGASKLDLDFSAP